MILIPTINNRKEAIAIAEKDPKNTRKSNYYERL